MPYVSKRADLLERSIEGLPSTDPEVLSLAATVRRIPALTSTACTPRDEFVTALGLRLRAEALTLPARQVHNASSASSIAGARRSSSRPKILVIGRGLPRVLAGATASLLLIGALVGVTSRSALPGGLFYPVKQVLDSAAVQLAASDLDRGVTLLAQAQEHIGDARSLVERDGTRADPASVDQALLNAREAASTGQRSLFGDFDRTGNTQALLAVRDFTVRAMPQLEALRPLVPAASRPEVDALIAVVHQSRTTLARTIAGCGQPCASLWGASLGSSPPSAPLTGPPLNLTGGPSSGVPTPGGLPVAGPKGGAGGLGAVVGPPAPALPIPRSGTGVAIPPPVTIVSPVIPPPVVVVPLPPPPHVPPLAPTAALPPPPTVLPGLP